MANEVKIKVTGDAKQAERALTGVKGKLQGLTNQLKSSGLAMAALGALSIATFTKMIKSVEDQRVGISLLDQALQKVNTSYKEQRKDIEAVIESLQRKTNFGDEIQRTTLQQLIALSGDYETSLKALPAVLDLAAALHISLSAATNLVGRGISGNTELFSRYGLTVETGIKPLELIALLTDKFGGAAEAASSPLTQLGNRLGDVAQVMVEALLPVILAAADALEFLSRKFIEFNEGIKPVKDNILGLLQPLTSLVNLIGGPGGTKQGPRSLFGLSLPPISSLRAGGLGGTKQGPRSLFGLSLPKLPSFQAGGIVRRPTLALVGEGGPEAIVPLSGGAGRGSEIVPLRGGAESMPAPGSGEINITIQAGAFMGSEADARQFARMIGRILQEDSRLGRFS